MVDRKVGVASKKRAPVAVSVCSLTDVVCASRAHPMNMYRLANYTTGSHASSYSRDQRAIASGSPSG